MIDYAFRFATEAAAITAASCAKDLGAFIQINPNSTATQWVWDTSYVLPNMKAWRISQDTSGIVPGSTIIFPPNGIPTTIHNYLTGWFAIVSKPSILAAYLNSTGLQFALNRDGPPWVVQNNIGGIITDIGCEPLFAGSPYPMGGLSTS